MAPEWSLMTRATGEVVTPEHGGLIRAAEVLSATPGLFDDIISPADIGYTHPVFLQCFMPTPYGQNIHAARL
jgi:hypothetical protein